MTALGKKLNHKTKETIAGWLLISPVVLGLLIFTALPFVLSFYYSFTQFDGITAPKFIGLLNYKMLFTAPKFYKTMWATAKYAIISVLLGLVLSFFLALLLNSKVKGVKVFRVLCYLPVIVPSVALAAIWSDMFNPTYVGIANRILKVFGISPKSWFLSDSMALPTFIFISLWGVGGSMMMWIAGFNGISPAYYEAADIEGASRIRKLVSITLPMMTPIIFYNLIMGVIAGLQTFNTAYIIGTNDSTKFIAVSIYENAFTKWNMGYASAMAWVLCFVIFCLTMVIFKTSKWVYYGDED